MGCFCTISTRRCLSGGSVVPHELLGSEYASSASQKVMAIIFRGHFMIDITILVLIYDYEDIGLLTFDDFCTRCSVWRVRLGISGLASTRAKQSRGQSLACTFLHE